MALHEWRNAQRLRRVISFVSREIAAPDEVYYGVRFVNLSVSPLAEATWLRVMTMMPGHVLAATAAVAAPTARQSPI